MKFGHLLQRTKEDKGEAEVETKLGLLQPSRGKDGNSEPLVAYCVNVVEERRSITPGHFVLAGHVGQP